MALLSLTSHYVFVQIPGNSSVEIRRLLEREERMRIRGGIASGQLSPDCAVFKDVGTPDDLTASNSAPIIFTVLSHPIIRFVRFMNSNAASDNALLAKHFDRLPTAQDVCSLLFETENELDLPVGLAPQSRALTAWRGALTTAVESEQIHNQLPRLFFTIFGPNQLNHQELVKLNSLNASFCGGFYKSDNIYTLLEYYKDDFQLMNKMLG